MYCIITSPKTNVNKKYVCFDKEYKFVNSKQEVLVHVKDHSCIHPFLFAKESNARKFAKEFGKKIKKELEIEQFI